MAALAVVGACLFIIAELRARRLEKERADRREIAAREACRNLSDEDLAKTNYTFEECVFYESLRKKEPWQPSLQERLDRVRQP